MANRRFAMSAAIGLRDDYGSGGLRAAAKRAKDGREARRVLALSGIYDRASRPAEGNIGRVGAASIESGPIPAIHGVVRWRIVDLRQWIFEEFRVVISEQTLSRVLRKMGYRKLSARPRHHAQAEGAIEDFKKVFPSAWKRSAARRASLPTP